MNNKPDLLVISAPHSATCNVIENLLNTTAINLLNREEEHYKEFLQFLSLEINESGFGYTSKYQKAFHWLENNKSLSAKSLAWQPESFIGHAPAQWATLSNLPGAKALFVLRSPADSVYLHYMSLQQEFEPTLDEALDRCQSEMNNVGAWAYRGKWERFFAKPAASTMLLEQCAYATAVSRCQKLLGKDNVHVIAYESYVANPEQVTSGFLTFLGETSRSEISVSMTKNMDEGISRYEPMPSSTRQRLMDYYQSQAQLLQEISGLDVSVWDFHKANNIVDNDNTTTTRISESKTDKVA